jgi:hypothetical protein
VVVPDAPGPLTLALRCRWAGGEAVNDDVTTIKTSA